MNIKVLGTAILSVILMSGCGSSFIAIKPLDLPAKTYKKSEIGKGVSFSIARPQFVIKTKISPDLERGITNRLQYDANAISCHLTSEIEHMLVARGIAIVDVFDSRNDMTFTQKKETTALLYPVVTINLLQSTTSTYEGAIAVNTFGNIMGTAEVSIVMLEPLSGEKVWIKHINSSKKSLPLNYKGNILNNANPFQIQLNLVGTANKLDALLAKIDAQILNAVDKYVTKDEFEYLNDDIKKLKGIKRY